MRWALLPALSLPLAMASLAASATGEGPPLELLWPLATLALVACVLCWRKVIVLWRALPRPDDDDQGWRRWWDIESPLGPDGGPGVIKFDWTSFERDFWAHVKEIELQRGRELVSACALEADA